MTEVDDWVGKVLKRLDDFRSRLEECGRGSPGAAPAGAAGELPDWVERGMRGFKTALDEDLNMPEALGALFDMIHDGNKALDTAGADASAARAALNALDGMDRVLGVRRADATGPDAAALELLDQRLAARKAKNWAESDRIRKCLAALGWEVRDTAEGQKVKRA